MGTTRQKSSCRNRLQNGPHSLLRMKVGTHLPSPTGSHTAAYTPKQGRFGQRVLSLPSERSARSQTSPGRVSERRTLPLLGLGRRRSRRTQRASGAAMRLCASLLRGVAAPLGYAASSAIWRCCFFRSAFGTFCVCEARGVSPLSACSTCRRNAGRPLVKTTNLLFPWSDRFFFDSSSTKYYPFFFTDTGRTSGRPAGSFAFVCISLTCPDRPDRGT